jgi:hypothetical protein
MTMIKATKKILVLALTISLSIGVSARRYEGPGGGGISNNSGSSEAIQDRAAACGPATAIRDLEWNNVQARIENGGSMWQDRANTRAAYIVPKPRSADDPKVSSLFSGALWVGGVSPDQQLKLAAVTFRGDGNDFWPGPLTNDGSAQVNDAVCLEYDKFYVSLRQDAQLHRQYYDLLQAGASAEEIAVVFPNGYSIPSYFFDYPAQGNTAAGQDYFLAPFYDNPNNPDGAYNPEDGDYPWYDFLRDIDCFAKKRESPLPLFGDQTYYWIFNDKGNAHSESQGQPIGLEIRAQAFAFTTNDEVNNMTFYNYLLINQGSQTLTETYFGSWVDCDLGNSTDDYVGCDVTRGLGYAYNGDADDQAISSSPGYGTNPPAVGVDFFEGPYQDADDLANPLTGDILDATDSLGIPYVGLGIGYGDTVVDNERFGMRRFVYYNIGTNPINGDPSTPIHYYNYMRGIWKNGQKMLYGGNGVATGVIPGLEADYMFPGDSDSLNWGTKGTVAPDWTEVSAGNAPGDRRFIQSAGPFTLLPGDYNNITVGVVWARASDGNPFQSVVRLREADDKAQALFDNCFELVSGPDAPDVTVQEMDREIILMLTNNNAISSNYQEGYGTTNALTGFDPGIPLAIDGVNLTKQERTYSFEGYIVYQLSDGQVGNNDLSDVSKARIIAQCDIRNGVQNIINYKKDPDTELVTPFLAVEGSDVGLKRSFRIVEDAFAQGNTALVNHKTYYFMVIAYGYNNYLDYDVSSSRGQSTPFLASRKGAIGEIKPVKAIPHNVAPEAGGTIAQSRYGDGVPITRIEGKGNSLNNMVFSSNTESEILKSPYNSAEPVYIPGSGPVNIKIVDPLRVQPADFELFLRDTTGQFDPDSMKWVLKNVDTGQEINGLKYFSTSSEDIVLQYGISIDWGQYRYVNSDGAEVSHFTDLVSSSIEFDNSARPWLGGIPDLDGGSEMNWIRSGTSKTEGDAPPAEQLAYDDYEDGSGNFPFTDQNEFYEKVNGGTWSPYCLVSYTTEPLSTLNNAILNNAAPTTKALHGDLWPIGANYKCNVRGLNNVDVVLTSNRDLWTRCPVLEMQSIEALSTNDFGTLSDPARKLGMRRSLSVDKYGKKAGDPGYNDQEGNLTNTWGMGWFPGYAIDLGTGERLNMAFGEDSWLVAENGRDMIWNPTSRLYSDIGSQALFGGQHWIYVFKNLRSETNNDTDYMSRYDAGAFMASKLVDPDISATNEKKLWRACTWVGSALVDAQFPMLDIENGLIPNDVRISLRVGKPYEKYAYDDSDVNNPTNAINAWRPLYRFSTRGIEAITTSNSTLVDNLSNINVVPNPYYAFSEYEANKLDNRVKITNLPEKCVVSIYDMNGTLIRQYKKVDPTTSLDWDLKNFKNIPISSGTYIIHIDVPDVGEKILKWFGVMRPVDLDNF